MRTTGGVFGEFRHLTLQFACICLASYIVGCGGHKINIALDPTRPIPSSEGVVFGRIQIEPPCPECLSFNIVNMSTSKEVGVFVLEDEDFTWHLPPGEYAILNYTYLSYEYDSGSLSRLRTKKSTTSTIHRPTRFVVPPPGNASYIGSLKIGYAQVGEANWLQKDILRRFELLGVVDEYQTALLDFQSKFPALATMTDKNLMILEVLP